MKSEASTGRRNKGNRDKPVFDSTSRLDEMQLLEVTPEESSVAGQQSIGLNLSMGSDQKVSNHSLSVIGAHP